MQAFCDNKIERLSVKSLTDSHVKIHYVQFAFLLAKYLRGFPTKIKKGKFSQPNKAIDSEVIRNIKDSQFSIAYKAYCIGVRPG